MKRAFLVTIEDNGPTLGLQFEVGDILSNHYEWVEVEEVEQPDGELFDVRLTHVDDRSRHGGTIKTIKALRDLELPRSVVDGSYVNDLKFQRYLVFTVLGRNPTETPYDRVNTMLAWGVTRQRAEEIRRVLDLVGARVEVTPNTNPRR